MGASEFRRPGRDKTFKSDSIQYWPGTDTLTFLSIVAEDDYEHAFAAAGTTNVEARVLPNDKLELRAAFCDRIVSLSDPNDPKLVRHPGAESQGAAFETTQFLSFILKSAKLASGLTSYPTGETVEEVLFRTAVRGPPWHKSDFEVHTKELDSLRHAFWQHLNLSLIGDKEGTPEAKRRKVTKAPTSVFNVDTLPRLYKRRFCITERGYFGLVPADAQVGDLMAIVLGGHVPFVLRRAERFEKDHFELIGDGYFHGLMHGKALELSEVVVKNILIV